MYFLITVTKAVGCCLQASERTTCFPGMRSCALRVPWCITAFVIDIRNIYDGGILSKLLLQVSKMMPNIILENCINKLYKLYTVY